MSLILLLGIGAIGWSSFSVLTGKGYYKGRPPGGYDRDEDPCGFWAPTIVIFCMGAVCILVSLGVVPLHPRQ